MIRGAAIVAFPLSVGLASAAAGSKSLFAVALGFTLLCILLLAALQIAARRVTVSRIVDRHEVLEEHPITVRFGIGRLGVLPVRVEIRGANGRWRPLVHEGAPALDGATHEEVVVDRPGAHMLGPSPLRLRDDLGLMTRRIPGGDPQALLVLPLPEALPSLVAAGGAEHLGDIEPDGLRPYVPGTPMSRIHWPSAARGAELQERHFIAARDRLPLVVVDLAGAPSAEAIDWTARAAAGTAMALARRGGCRVALPGDRVASTLTDPTVEWAALHRRLAALDDLAAIGAPTFRPGVHDRDALIVRAADAPADGLHERAPLPPGVVSLADWTDAA
ncbi:MAG: DUF58 domain-containing protein [Solirubrobacteraceae bacterium]|nr:DUF58 domain-containing protein [Patulibacter sp.]